MQISEKGVKAIMLFEGCKLRAYLCSAGVPTIGCGHTATVTMEDVTAGRTITMAQATALLDSDLDAAERAVNDLVRAAVSQPQYDALVSFVFNVGRRAFARSTMLRMIDSGDFAGAGLEFAKWIYAGGKRDRGLERRRAAESDMFLFGTYPDTF